MKVTIQNVRGLESAEIDMTKIALVTGDNMAGKTSICLPIACALSGVTTPLGIRKTDGGMMVRVGTGRGSVNIKTDDGEVTIEWPKCERSTQGDAPTASKIATGIESIVDMDTKERGSLLGNLLNIVPTRDDFNQALADAGMTPRHKDDPERFSGFDKVWATIERDGWDAAADRAQKAGTEQKGAWRQVTTENYGTKKADTWLPDGWSGELAQRSKDTLEADIAAERNELEFKVGKQAISAERLQELQDKADEIDGCVLALKKIEADAVMATEASTKARSVRDACLPATESDGHSCPKCGTFLEMTPAPGNTREKVLSVVAKLSDADLKARRDAIAAADGALEKAYAESRAANSSVADARRDLDAAKAARAELDRGATTSGSSADDVDKAREGVRRAENALRAFQQKTEADRIHTSIQRNEMLVTILSTAGVRRAVLLRALSEFNKRIASICADAKWGLVSITDAMTVEVDGRPYVMMAGSEQFRARVAFQVAIAELDKSAAVVIDGADILSNSGRAGLLRMLVARKMPALIGMTMEKSASLPPLAEKGFGVVYRVENGKSDVIGGA